MKLKDRQARDAFTLSLDGMRTVNAFAIVPVIAPEALRQDPDRRAQKSHGQKRCLWIPQFLRVS